MPQSQLSRWLLTRDEKDRLINGYIREETGDLFHSVLIEVVRLFYNNLRSLQINGNNFHDFLDEKKPMVTQMFSISNDASCQNIKFRMGICPLGIRKNKDDAIEFYIKLKELPSIPVPVGSSPGVPAIWEQKRDRLYTLEEDHLDAHHGDAVSKRYPLKWRNARNWNFRDKLRSKRSKARCKRSKRGMMDRVRSMLSLEQSRCSSVEDRAMTTDDGLSDDSRGPSRSASPSPSVSPSPSETAMEKEESELMEVQRVEQIEIYYELYCQETQCEWKGVTMMTLNEYIVWSPLMMRLSECNQFGSLFFSSDIDVLSLHFKDGRMKPVAHPTWMNKDECFEWNIDDEQTVKRIHSAGSGQCYFSPNFGGINEDNWCCKYYPEGIKGDDEKGAIFLCLLRKPMAIKKLKVRYRIECGRHKVVDEEKEFSGVTRSNGEWMEKVSKSTMLEWGEAVRFRVNITILELYGHDDCIIDIGQWTRAGVTRLKPF